MREDCPPAAETGEVEGQPMAELPVPAASCRAPGRAKLRLRNDTFYDDYLHRGRQEPFTHMSYYDYGVHVRVVPGDPYDLCCNQYAFVAHHGKHDNYVQELQIGRASCRERV